MRNKLIKIISVVLLLLIAVLFLTGCQKKDNQNDNFKIVTSFYPIYIMLLNLTTGAQNIELSNMADTNVGCIHDYTLRTEDLKKVQDANAFIINGLGLESFIEKILENNKNINVIDSSEGITDLIKENDSINPHIWTSTKNYIKQVEVIANKLGELNPENKEIYLKNAENYIASINNVKKEYSTKLETLRGKSAICLNESFEYLGKELGMDFITVKTNHEESTMSAEMLSELVNQIKEKNIKYIIIDKNDDTKNAETIQRETGASIYKLDSGLTGSLSKESYIHALKGNYRILLGEE